MRSSAVLGPNGPRQRTATIAIVVAALGYFVDMYDLVLFALIRTDSLRDLGLSPAELLTEGEWLLSLQMFGMLAGGVLWGVLGDRKGRLYVLFGSILTYSLANIANGFVNDLTTYQILRFIAGVGLAGELGAGITLVSELVRKEKRGVATTLVAACGLLGAVAAGLITMVNWGSEIANWRITFFIGGGMGLMLLLLRIGVFESGMYTSLRNSQVARGNFLALFTDWNRFGRFMRCILIGVPVWYIVGLFVVFLVDYLKHLPVPPELAAQANTKVAITLCYAGIAFGDLASGMLSQVLRSRKKAILTFMLMSMVATAYYLSGVMTTLTEVYVVCTFLGFATGYWAVFVTVASEQFGTNLRATVTTTVPNFVRGSLPLIYLLNGLLRDDFALGFVPAAVIVGVLVFGVALWAWWGMRETFARDLDFVEE